MKKSPALYFKLFTSTFYLSAFTFGGGYVIIPLMKKKFADDLHWIEEKEMLDLTAIAPVSYTHLDVYKRQLYDRRRSLSTV